VRFPIKSTGIRLALAGVLLGSLPSCAAIAVAGVGVAISQEFMDNSVSYYVPGDVGSSWVAAKRVVNNLSMDPIKTDEAQRTLEAVVDGSMIYVRVEAFDINETKVQVMAKRALTYENELASDIAFRIRHSLDR
jgi:hypothetical protein